MSGRPCTTCGHLLPEGSRFCGQCGAKLGEGAAVPPAAPAAISPPAAPAAPAAPGAISPPAAAMAKSAARTMVEFQAPPPPTTRRGEYDDSATVKRDRADLVELMKAYDADLVSQRQGPHEEETMKRPRAAEANAADARADLAKTIANPLGRTIADPTPYGAGAAATSGATFGATAGAGPVFDKTIADSDAAVRAREMVLGAIRDGNIAPPQPASLRPEPPLESPPRPSQKPPSDLKATRADAFLQAQHRAEAFGAASPERSPLSHSLASSRPPPPEGPKLEDARAPAEVEASRPPAHATISLANHKPASNPPQATISLASNKLANKTMVGVSALDLASMNAAAQAAQMGQASQPAQPSNASQAPPPPPPPQPQPAPHGISGASKTMLGVAIPGIAPLNPGQAHAPQPGPQPPGGAQGPAAFASNHRTMLGVAIPGIAPTHGGASAGAYPAAQGASYPPPQPRSQQPAPPIAPMPAPYVEEAMPAAPAIPRKRGVPIVAAVGALVVLLLAGATVLFLLYKPAPPVIAAPELDAEGRDVLKLTCQGCPDGTTVTVGAATATLAAHEGRLLLPSPLKVGQNPLVLRIDRPGAGRDEDARIEVPVAFRLRADLTTLAATPPAITVRVEAQAGADVRVEGKPVALDSKGEGSLAIDVGADASGPSDETKRIDRTIEYSITPAGGAPQKGTVRAQAGIAALHIDTPSSHAVVEADRVWVSGQTTPLAEVRVNDLGATADASGLFAVELSGLAMGETKIHVAARPKNFAARTLDFAVTRVAHLEDAAKAFESESPLGYDAFTDGTSARKGAKVAVDGEIIEARRGTPHQWLLVVDSKRGCKNQGQCIVRVQAAGEDPVASGDHARVYGRYLRSVTSRGKTYPEVAADVFLVQKGAP